MGLLFFSVGFFFLNWADRNIIFKNACALVDTAWISDNSL